jgi:hypothetical protein
MQMLAADSAIEVRAAREDDLPRLKCFLQETFDGKLDLDTWSWKYKDNPYGSPTPVLALVESQIAGHLGMVSLPFQLSDKKIRAAIPADYAVHPRFRAMSLGQAGILNQLRCAGFAALDGRADLAFMIPIAGFYVLARRHLKYEPLVDLTRFHLNLGLGTALARRRAPRWARVATARLSSVRAALRDSISHAGVQVREESISEELDGMLERCRGRGTLGVWKDVVYLRWRYAQCPRPAIVLVARKAGIPTGILAFRVVDAGEFRFARVLDLLAQTDDPATAAALLRAAQRRALLEHCEVMEAWSAPGDPLAARWRSAGFSAQPEPIHTLMDSSRLGLEDSAVTRDTDRWRLAIGDSDGS